MGRCRASWIWRSRGSPKSKALRGGPQVRHGVASGWSVPPLSYYPISLPPEPIPYGFWRESGLLWYFDGYSRTLRTKFHSTDQAESNPTNHETLQDN